MDKRVKFDVFQGGKNIDITMFQYGWEQCLPMHSYGPAKRNHYLFHYVLSGKGFLSSNNMAGETKLYKLEACQGFLICPGQVNTYYADDKKPWEYAWVEFDGLKAVEFMRQSGVDFDHPVYRLKKRELHDYIKSEIMQLVDNPYSSDVNQIGHLYLFFDGLIRGGGGDCERHPVLRKTERRLCAGGDLVYRTELRRRYYGGGYRRLLQPEPELSGKAV